MKKLDQAHEQLAGRLGEGERVLVNVSAVPMAYASGIAAGPGAGIVRANDRMIQRNAVTGEAGSIALGVPTAEAAFGLVLTDRRLALYHRNVMMELDELAWEVPRKRVVGIRKLARTTLMRRLRIAFDDGSAVELSVPPGRAMGMLRDELGTLPR